MLRGKQLSLQLRHTGQDGHQPGRQPADKWHIDSMSGIDGALTLGASKARKELANKKEISAGIQAGTEGLLGTAIGTYVNENL